MRGVHPHPHPPGVRLSAALRRASLADASRLLTSRLDGRDGHRARGWWVRGRARLPSYPPVHGPSTDHAAAQLPSGRGFQALDHWKFTEAQKLLAQRRPRRPFFEPSIRALIILCASLAVVLSSLSICDGHWLLVDDRLFGLWHFCTTSNQAELHCLRDLRQAHVPGLASGMAVARSVATLAVVVAIFGLELLMVSQVSEDAHSSLTATWPRRLQGPGPAVVWASHLPAHAALGAAQTQTGPALLPDSSWPEATGSHH
ncbi:uncharacterized protein LOC111171362 [Delphinapterus leucas]|uniref:Uncharacterized protein LOC111171362 n=1 Tax=Delphinapterus leucas TaxID=9749 RepID=A0A7F8KBU4_DELLE|nr:uncharacterized protein LOC111171362 [Delphinapterus leucas]